MNRSLRILSAAAAVALAVPAMQTTSVARTALPSSGRTFSMADMGCFSLSYSSMTNVCGTAKYIEIPLTHDSPIGGWLSPRVTAQGTAPAGNVGCTATAIHKSLGYYWSNAAGYEYVPVFGSPQDIVLDVYAPGDAGLYVTCEVHPWARVNLVTW